MSLSLTSTIDRCLLIVLLVLGVAPVALVRSEDESNSTASPAPCNDLCANVECGSHGSCSAAGDCICTDGYTGTNCTLPPTVTWSWSVGEYGPCSVECGSGTQNRSVTCVGSDLSINTDGSACTGQPEPVAILACANPLPVGLYWSWSDWSICSVSCGSGLQTRTLSCKGADGEVHSDACCFISPGGPQPLPSTQDCWHPCVNWTWVVTPFGSCSVACGTGIQNRTVTCVASNKTIDFSGKECSDQMEPDSSQPCNTAPCGTVTYSWSNNDWSSCSVTCGTGIQIRSVECQGSDGQIYSDSYCNTMDPPVTSQPCTQPTCHSSTATWSWVVGEYGTCSATCGGATRTRSVTCVSSDGGLSLDGSKCIGQVEPTFIEVCTPYVECPFQLQFFWRSTDWSCCSVRCGMGVQTSDAFCIAVDLDHPYIYDMDGAIYDDSYCTLLSLYPIKPPTIRTCYGNDRACLFNWAWVVSPWGTCSTTCGSGISTRSVTCTNSAFGTGPDSIDVNGTNCAGRPKPFDTMSCSTPCPPLSSPMFSLLAVTPYLCTGDESYPDLMTVIPPESPYTLPSPTITYGTKNYLINVSNTTRWIGLAVMFTSTIPLYVEYKTEQPWAPVLEPLQSVNSWNELSPVTAQQNCDPTRIFWLADGTNTISIKSLNFTFITIDVYRRPPTVLAQWLTIWSSCNALCGTGEQVWEVLCIPGWPDLDCSQIGPRPIIDFITRPCNTEPCGTGGNKSIANYWGSTGGDGLDMNGANVIHSTNLFTLLCAFMLIWLVMAR